MSYRNRNNNNNNRSRNNRNNRPKFEPYAFVMNCVSTNHQPQQKKNFFISNHFPLLSNTISNQFLFPNLSSPSFSTTTAPKQNRATPLKTNVSIFNCWVVQLPLHVTKKD